MFKHDSFSNCYTDKNPQETPTFDDSELDVETRLADGADFEWVAGPALVPASFAAAVVPPPDGAWEWTELDSECRFEA
jgi:hypothetical protein